jgi:hypothetical protein
MRSWRGVGGRGLARLRKLAGKRGLGAMERARKPVGAVVLERRARQDEAERADRVERRIDARIGPGRNRDRLEEGMLGADARALLRARRDEACAARARGHRGEAGPADAAAPQRRGATVQHHGGPVAGALEIDRLEILLLVEPEPVEHVARQDHQPGPARPERHRLALEVIDRAVRTVGAHDEHAGSGVHGGDDLEIGGRAPDTGQRLIRDLALHQRDVELAFLEQRHVLG